jgi:hypothetical protein
MKRRDGGERVAILWLAAIGVLVAGAACNTGGGSGGTAAPPAASGAAPAAGGDVVRYGASEIADTGSYTVASAVRARKAADQISATIQILQPGATVGRVARYGGYSLVQWGTPQGNQLAWVETAQMVRPVYYDAGVTGTPFGSTPYGVGQGQVGAQPPAVAAPTAVATTPPPPATTPPPPATVTRPLVVTKPIFTPPKVK